MSDRLEAQFINTANFDLNSHVDPNAAMPTTGTRNGLTLTDLRGVAYDDEAWETLLDQLTVTDMRELMAIGGYQTVAAPAARPAISGAVENMAQYDVIFLGYPIWHGQAPRIIMESYDLSEKTIVPFCTSGSSPIGSSTRNIQPLAPGAQWLEGRRFSGSASRDMVASWVNGLNLPQQTEQNKQEGENTMLSITINGTTLTAELADNSSARALRELLASGPRTIQMHDYGNMEKAGPLGQSLPTNNEQIDTEAGDIILYQGNQIVIYYDHNSWNFTRLGKVNDMTADELREVLGDGSETGFLISVVDHMLTNYPVDSQRVYSTGFSNGGVASVALTRDYPPILCRHLSNGLDGRPGQPQWCL